MWCNAGGVMLLLGQGWERSVQPCLSDAKTINPGRVALFHLTSPRTQANYKERNPAGVDHAASRLDRVALRATLPCQKLNASGVAFGAFAPAINDLFFMGFYFRTAAYSNAFGVAFGTFVPANYCSFGTLTPAITYLISNLLSKTITEPFLLS